jgi:hypothetical protein
MEPTASQVRNQYSSKNQEAYLERALARAFRRQRIFIANQMCELPTQLSRIVLEIATVQAIILTK